MIHIIYQIKENKSKVTTDKIYDFLKKIDQVYLQLSPGHQSFKLINSDKISLGAIIENKEKAAFQTVTHKYTVEVDTPEKIVLVSPSSKVKIGHLFSMPVHVSVSFFIEEDTHHIRLKCKLDLKFKNVLQEALARLTGTSIIWKTHLKEELENGREIFLSI
jgi:hypothetical protein